jgi:hypothetical protein
MGLFSRKKDSVPQWASFFSAKEYAVFIGAVTNYADALGVAWENRDGILVLLQGEFADHQYGLDNLARLCKQNHISEYPQIVAGHFDSMLAGQRFENEFRQNLADFEYVRPYIAVRVYGADYLEIIQQDDFAGRPLADGLFAAIVYDFPSTVSLAQLSETTPWGKTVDELIALGLENVRKGYDFPIIPMASGEGAEREVMFVCETEHIFAANILLDLDRHPGLVGPSGALVIAPSRNAVICYPINDLKVVQAVNFMSGMAANNFAESPGPLSDKLYWYKDGVFTVIPYQFKNDELSVMPPQEFVEMLNSLAG